MIIHSIFFYIFSIIAVFSAIMVTVSRNTVHSVFFLILDFITISCLFIMIGAEFIGMIMLIVYVGAVAVLFLFVVMMLNVSQQKNTWLSGEKNSNHIPIGLLISTIIFFELIIVAGGWKYKPELLIILLVAMIGAIVLTFRKREGIRRQSYFKQISRERKDGVELVDVEKNKGVNIDV